MVKAWRSHSFSPVTIKPPRVCPVEINHLYSTPNAVIPVPLTPSTFLTLCYPRTVSCLPLGLRLK